MPGRGLWQNNTDMLVFFMFWVKFLKNLYIIDLLIPLWDLPSLEFLVWFQVSHHPHADLQNLTDVPYRITRTCTGFGATQDVALHVSKICDNVWHDCPLHKLKSDQSFALTSSFLSNRQIWVVLDGKSLQDYHINTEVPQGSFLGPTVFLLNQWPSWWCSLLSTLRIIRLLIWPQMELSCASVQGKILHTEVHKVIVPLIL